jgi:mannose-6-phosphate isomerase-like protein (cupin superfamily)
MPRSDRTVRGSSEDLTTLLRMLEWGLRNTRRKCLNSKPIFEAIVFSEEKMKKNALFDSPHLFYDVYCLLPGQHQKVHAHEGSDKVYYVLAGTGRFTVGHEEQDLPKGHVVIAPAGEPHGVRNEADENLVLLVTMAPRPS